MSVHERSSFPSFTVESLPQETHSTQLQEGKHVSTQGHDFSANAPKSEEAHKAEKSFTDAHLDVQKEATSKPRRAVNIAVGAAATLVETIASKVAHVGNKLLQFGKKLSTEKGRGEVKSQVSQGFKDIKTKAGDLKDAAVDKFKGVKEALPGRVRELKENAPEAIKTTFKKVNTAVTSFFKKLGSAEGRKELANDVKDAAIQFKDKSIAVFESGSKNVKKGFTSLKKGAADLKSQLEPKLEAYEAKGGKITNDAGEKLDGLRKDAGEKLGELKKDAGEKLDGLRKDAGEKLGELKKSAGEKLGGMREAFKTKWEALTSSKEKTKAVASQNPAISSTPSDSSGETAAPKGPSTKEYGQLLSELQEKGSDYTLSFSKEENKLVINEKGGVKGAVPIDKKSRAAMKEMLGAVSDEMKKDPLSALDLLNKMRASDWGQQVMRFNPDMKSRFQKLYQAGLEQCCNQSGAKFASLLSQVTREELFASGSHAGKPTYAENCPHLNEATRVFNDISYAVGDKVVSQSNFKERVKTMEMYIRLADMADKKGDLMTSQAILAGLSLAHVSRLKKTQGALPNEVKVMLRKLQGKQGSPSLDAAPQERAAMLEYTGNKQGRSLIPSIAMAFLSPLTFAADKQDPLKDAKKNIEWSNGFIDQTLRGESLEESIKAMNEEILNLKGMIENGAPGTTLKLTFRRQDLEAKLKEAMAIHKFSDYVGKIKEKDKSLEEHISSLKEELADVGAQLESSRSAELEIRHQNLSAEIKIAENLGKRLEKLIADNPDMDTKALLTKLKEENEANIKTYQVGIAKYQKELDTLADEFETLATPLGEYPVKETEGAQAWYSYTLPIPESQIPEGKKKDSFFEDYYYKLSLKNEPREAV